MQNAMIRFFRQIRQSLLTENRVSKYLLYALGEILLVVIGILIALQVNNWNEDRKQQKLEQDYYCRLLGDVELDQKQVADLLEASSERVRASNRAVRLLIGKTPSKVEVALEINNAIKAIYADFTPNDAAFQDLKSGANLNIIQDKTVISALNNYFKKAEGLISVIQVNGQNAVKIFYSHSDVFANGWANASLKSGWAGKGIDPDLRDQLSMDEKEALTDDMQYRLLNESLLILSHNQRQIILYNTIQEEIARLRSILKTKCP
jgi:hypothetical protein